jgi:hypothetical protein
MRARVALRYHQPEGPQPVTPYPKHNSSGAVLYADLTVNKSTAAVVLGGLLRTQEPA